MAGELELELEIADLSRALERARRAVKAVSLSVHVTSDTGCVGVHPSVAESITVHDEAVR